MILLDFISFIAHLDANLTSFIQAYGFMIYPLVFLIVFCETGLVVTPFLPGDSLLFAVGALASRNLLSLWLAFSLLFTAAVLGDNLNYWIGRFIGPKVFRENSRFLKKEYLLRTEEFYKKHGVKTIILARFMPIIRTFSPFVAGVGRMHYPRFLIFDVLGGLIWISLFLFGGFFFGELPFVKNHFSLLILGIIIVSLIPLMHEFIKSRRNK